MGSQSEKDTAASLHLVYPQKIMPVVHPQAYARSNLTHRIAPRGMLFRLTLKVYLSSAA